MSAFLTALLAAEALLWAGLAAHALRGGNWRPFGRCLAYHVLTAAAVVMVLPFYWMLATSLKDFQTANQSPPAWLPLGTHYYADGAALGVGPAGGEVEVGLLRDGGTPWEQLRTMGAVSVAPADRLNEKEAARLVPGAALRRVRRPEWSNYVEAWEAPARNNPGSGVTFTRYLYVSVVTTAATTLGTLITSVLAAYAFAKMRFRGKHFLFLLVLATMMVPGQTLLIPNFLILSKLPDWTLGMRWLDAWPALIVPWLASVFSIFLLRQFFMGIPDDLWDAAQIDGAGRFRYLWQIVVPLSKPALVSAGIFIFLGEWNNLLWPLIVTTRPEMRTLMVGLQTFSEEMAGNYNLLMAAATIAVLPVVALFFFLQRFFVEGIARSGIK